VSPQWKAPKAGKSATANPVFRQITRKGQKQLPKLDFPHLKLLKNECQKKNTIFGLQFSFNQLPSLLFQAFR